MLHYAIILLDLIKAFERIPHWFLVQQAMKYGFSSVLLKLSIAAYKLARVVGVQGVFSNLLFASRGITAGSVFATIEMRIVVIEALDLAAAACLHVRLTCYVDDVALEQAGSAESVEEDLAAVTLCFTKALEDAGLEFSATKNTVSASVGILSDRLAKKLARLKVRRQDRVKSLGTPMGAGRRRNAQVAKARLAAFKARKSRFHLLKKAKVEVARLLRTGGIAALTYGQESMGVSNTALLSQRRAVAATLATEGNGDLDLRLALADGTGKAKVDPAFAAHLQPIGSWAEAVWSTWLPHGTLASLMQRTADRFYLGIAWAKVHGPAAACYASARRLGWHIKSAFVFNTDIGQELHLMRDSPAFVRLRVTESVQRWRDRAIVSRFPSLAGASGFQGPHLYPVVQLLSKGPTKRGWSREHTGALRSAVTGRQWTQQRLFQAGLAESSACRLCVALGRCAPDSDDPEFAGTLLHRHCTCPSLQAFRDQHMPPSVRTSLQESKMDDGRFDPQKVLWLTRALAPHPFGQAVTGSRDGLETFVWLTRPPDDLLAGDIYTDGSLMDNKPEFQGHCKALGWAFVILGPGSKVTAAAHGRPPAWVDTIYGAELWAVQMVMQHIFPGAARILTDCDSVRTGCERDQKWGTAPDQKYARVWSVIHAARDSEDSAPVIWMPAHTAERQINSALKSDGSVLTAVDRDANSRADQFAKAAASGNRVAEAARAFILKRHAAVADMATWIAKVTVEANHFRLPDGSFVRDSQAVKALAKGRRGRKRSAKEVIRSPATEVLWKTPRLDAVKNRVLARLKREAHEACGSGDTPVPSLVQTCSDSPLLPTGGLDVSKRKHMRLHRNRKGALPTSSRQKPALSHPGLGDHREHNHDLQQSHRLGCQRAITGEVHPGEVLQDLLELQQSGMQVIWPCGQGQPVPSGLTHVQPGAGGHQEAFRCHGSGDVTSVAEQGHDRGAAQVQDPEAVELAQALKDLQFLADSGLAVHWPAAGLRSQRPS